MEALSKRRDISLSALKQNDPFISSIVDVTSQVALYTFNPKSGEWEKTDIEVSIYSIWFYDKNDCQRIAQLMSKVVQVEARRVQQESPGRITPNKTNGYDEENAIDILDMLSKAKEEYEQTYQFGDSSILSSSPGIHSSGGLAVKTPIDECGSSSAHNHKNALPGAKHLTVEELFGAPVPKEQLINSNQETLKSQQDAKLGCQNLMKPFTYEQPTEKHLGSPESLNDKSSFTRLNCQETTLDVLMIPAALQKLDKPKCMYNICTSPHIHTSLNFEATSNQATSTISTSGHVQKLQQEVKTVSPLMMCPLSSDTASAHQNPSTGSNAASQRPTTDRNTLDIGSQGHDLLQKLKLAQQHDQQHQTLSKPSLAANFSPLLVTPECFKEPNVKTSEVSLQVVPTPTTSSVAPSMLLSPNMFKQSTGMISEAESKYASASPLTLASETRSSPLPTVLSKTQLQETLTHLIKNDSDFLNTIHEAYLQILLKNVVNIK